MLALRIYDMGDHFNMVILISLNNKEVVKSDKSV